MQKINEIKREREKKATQTDGIDTQHKTEWKLIIQFDAHWKFFWLFYLKVTTEISI